MVKRLSAMRETRIQALGQEDPLEKEMATHSGTLAWKIPWMEEPGRLWSMGSQSDMTEQLHFVLCTLEYSQLSGGGYSLLPSSPLPQSYSPLKLLYFLHNT